MNCNKIKKIIAKFFFTGCICCFCMKMANAQYKLKQGDRKRYQYTTPGIENMSPKKGISIDFSSLPTFSTPQQVNSNLNSQGLDELDGYQKIKAKIKAPLWNSDGLKAVIGLRYSKERFLFETTPTQEIINSTYQTNHTFSSVGTDLTILKPLYNYQYLVLRSGIGFNGDYERLKGINKNYFNYNISAFWGYKKNKNTEFGFGLSFNKNLHRSSIFPLVMYNHNFSDKWGIEMFLPKQAQLRLNANDKTIFKTGLEVTGATYLLRDPTFSENKEGLILNWADVRLGLTAQRQIFPILWVEASAGYRRSISSRVIDRFSNNTDNIVTPYLQGGAFANISIFLTPPKKR